MNQPYYSTAHGSRRRVTLFAFASPRNFYHLAGRLIPWFTALGVLTGLAGLALGMLFAPTDFQQGDAYRIIFVHVPAAWMSMLIYLAMAGWAAIGLSYHTGVSSIMASALAPTGALFTVLALWTGALWGKPTWGAWWVWDARLTSELILLFLYLGFMGLHASIADPRRADRAAAVLAIVGAVNIPIIYFSVYWWNTLHQGPSVTLGKAPSMAPDMFTAMLLMVAAFWCYGIAVALRRARCIVLERHGSAAWLRRRTI